MNGSLEKIAKGGIIAFVGMLTYIFLEFIARVIIARYTTQSEYGAFCIGLTLLNIFVLISCLGLQGGATRCIAYFRGKENYGKVRNIVFSAAQLSFIASIICFLISFFLSDFLASLFHLQQSTVLKMFSVAIPFSVAIEILASIFRGFNRVEEKVYFRDVLLNVLKVLFITTVILLGYSFIELIYAYTLPIVITSIAFMVYAIKKLPLIEHKSADTHPMRKTLLLFSLPLLVTNALGIILMQIDTLMLGYFKTTDIVGAYNAAHPIAQLIQIFLLSLVFIYLPVTSQLYSKNCIDEMQRNYMILTKWIVSATLPPFFIILLFPEVILNVSFGSTYAQANVATTLQILAIGMFIHVFLGPNAATLIAVGKTQLNLMDNLIGAITNISLNLLLIPTHGIIGAASASTISLATINVLKSAQIFRMYRIHPFTPNYLKPIVLTSVSVSTIYVIFKIFYSGIITIQILIIFSFLILVLHGTSIVITKSYDDVDKLILVKLKKIKILKKVI